MRALAERFWEKVEKSDDCWLWASCIGSRGYGHFWVGGKKRQNLAHRVAWELANGKSVPDGMVVMHSCDNPACVNPAHLFVGSHQDNKIDSVRKGRHAHGETNGGGGKLTRQQAREIRESRGALSITKAATTYGVSLNTVKRIRRGDLWRSA
jgi:hypothetical protein